MHSKAYSYSSERYGDWDTTPLTTTYVNIHHNGDYSGDVIINTRVVPYGVNTADMTYPEWDKKYPVTEISLSMDVILEFVAEYVRHETIKELENAPARAILGIPDVEDEDE